MVSYKSNRDGVVQLGVTVVRGGGGAKRVPVEEPHKLSAHHQRHVRRERIPIGSYPTASYYYHYG